MFPMFKFNRFGEELADVSINENGVSEATVNKKILTLENSCKLDTDLKIKHMKEDFSSKADIMFDKVKTDLLDKAHKQVGFEKNVIDVKKKRIINALKATNKTDVVIMDQLNEVNSKIDGILQGLEVTKDCIKIKNGRKICGISKSTSAYDAINGLELLELTKRVSKLESRSGKSRATTTDI